MGEHAEYELRRQMLRGTYEPKVYRRGGRNPIVRECSICGKGTRAIGDDEEAGLQMHMKAKHSKDQAYDQ